MNKIYWKTCRIAAQCMLWVLALCFVGTVTILLWKTSMPLAIITGLILLEATSARILKLAAWAKAKQGDCDSQKDIIHKNEGKPYV